MIRLILKFSVTFIVCFIVLSFQINNKTIFSHLSAITGPIGTEVQSSLKKSVKRSYDKSKEIGEEFFSNSDPKYTDTVKSKRSSVRVKSKNDGLTLEEIHQNDVDELDKIIKKN